MVIDYQREEEELEQARLAGAKLPAPRPAKHHLPVKEALDAKHTYDLIEDAKDTPAGQTVVDSAKQGLSRGFSNGLTTGMAGGSPLAGLAVIAEAAEEGLTAAPTDIDERMERFPELRDVHLETGAAARFPELAEERPQAQGVSELEDAEQER